MKKYIIAGVAVLGTVGVAAASMYAGIVDPKWNPFRPSPERVLAEMLQKSKDVASARTKATIDITQKQEGKELFTISIAFDDQSGNSASQGTFEASLSTEGMSYSLAGEYKVNDKEAYMKFTTIPALPFLALFLGGDFENIKEQWIKLETEETASEEEQDKLLQDFVDILAKSLKVEQLADESVQGKNAYHYQTYLTEEALQKMFVKMDEWIKALESIEGDSYGTADYEEATRMLKDMPFDLWIGKKDKLAYQVSFQKDIDMKDIDPGEKGTLSISMLIQMSEYGKEVHVEFPKDAKPLEEVLESLYPSYNDPYYFDDSYYDDWELDY